MVTLSAIRIGFVVGFSLIVAGVLPAGGDGTHFASIRVLEVPPDWIHLLAFLPGDRLLAASWREAQIWDTETWACVARLEREGGPGGVIGVSPDGTVLLVHTAAGEIEAWTASSQEKRGTLCRLDGSHRPRTAFSPDGQLVAVKTRGHDVEIWSVEHRNLVHILSGDTSHIFSLAFSPDGRWLASGTGRIEGTANASVVRIWDVASGTLVATLPAPTIANCLDLDFATDGSILVASGTYGILVFGTEGWSESLSIVGHRAWSHGAAISPDGRVLVNAGDEGGIRFWDVISGALLRELFFPSKVSCVTFSADGALLACAVADGTVHVLGLP